MNYETVGVNVIFYSLGNFIFDTDYHRAQAHTDEGVLLKLKFTEDALSFEAAGTKTDRATGRISLSPLPAVFRPLEDKDYAVLDPYVAARNDNLCAINATMQIDLIGQCGSESLGHLPYSGTGGQVDFVRAANRSKGGKAFIVLPSTAKGGTVSRIAPVLSPGTHVTTSKNDINYVVTEYGVAQLRGKTAKQRAEALIGIAHPDFRGELREAARKMSLL